MYQLNFLCFLDLIRWVQQSCIAALERQQERHVNSQIVGIKKLPHRFKSFNELTTLIEKQLHVKLIYNEVMTTLFYYLIA